MISSPMRSSVRGILHGDDRDSPIVFVHADGEDAGHPKGAHARHHADRRDIALRTISTTRSPTLRAELSASALPRITRYVPGTRSARRPDSRCGAEIDDAPLLVRQHAAHQHARRTCRRGSACACSSIYGAAAATPGKCASLLKVRAPVRDPALEPGDGRMRREAQDPRAQLLLEAVHDRQHHDEHGDAEREARVWRCRRSGTRSRASAMRADSAVRESPRTSAP